MQRCSYLGNNVSNVNEISLEPAKKNKKIHTLPKTGSMFCIVVQAVCRGVSPLCTVIFSL